MNALPARRVGDNSGNARRVRWLDDEANVEAFDLLMERLMEANRTFF